MGVAHSSNKLLIIIQESWKNKESSSCPDYGNQKRNWTCNQTCIHFPEKNDLIAVGKHLIKQFLEFLSIKFIMSWQYYITINSVDEIQFGALDVVKRNSQHPSQMTDVFLRNLKNGLS